MDRSEFGGDLKNQWLKRDGYRLVRTQGLEDGDHSTVYMRDTVSFCSEIRPLSSGVV